MNNPDTDKNRSLIKRIKKFIEKNREDNRRHPTGWHERLQNLYSSHHQINKLQTGNPNQWQKYSDKK